MIIGCVAENVKVEESPVTNAIRRPTLVILSVSQRPADE